MATEREPTIPRVPWQGPPYAPKHRGLRADLDAFARGTAVAIEQSETIERVVLRRRLGIRTPHGALRGLETITPLSYLLSIQPAGTRASALYMLAQARTYGLPTTMYTDHAGDVIDYTMEWRGQIPVTAADMARLTMRGAIGMRADPLSIEDLERLALAQE